MNLSKALDEVDGLLDEGEIPSALEKAAALVERFPDEPPVWIQFAEVCYAADDPDGCRQAATRAISLGSSQSGEAPQFLWEASLLLAQCEWRLWGFAEAEKRLRALLDEREEAFAWSFLARICEQTGRTAEAAEADRRAARMDPEFGRFPELTDGEVEIALGEVVEAFPEPFQALLLEIPIVVQDYPTAQMAAAADDSELPLPPDILGLFVGHSRLERSSFNVLEDPGSIFLFRRNLERACVDRDSLIEEISITLEHEFAHYLGFEEPDMPGLGLE